MSPSCLLLPDCLPHILLNNSPTIFHPETGIYRSIFKTIALPTHPNLDITSFVFSSKHEGVTALIDSQSGFSISYSHLREMVDSLACGLQKMGLCQGHIVFLFMHNSVYFPVILLAVLSLGAVITTMSPLSSPAEVMKQVNDTEVVLAFTSPEHVEKLKQTGLDMIFVPERVISVSSPMASRFHMLLSCDTHTLQRPVINQHDTALLLYSSGTTGISKGVIITHGNLIAVIRLLVQFESSLYGTLPWDAVYLAAIPMFHVYGLVFFATGLLSLGSKIIVMRRFEEYEMVNAIETYRVTHFLLVPPILNALTRAKCKPGCYLNSLKFVSCGGAPLTNAVLDTFVREFPFVNFIQGYGLTETTALGTRGFNTNMFKKHKSAGLLSPNVRAKVVDLRTGSCLPPGKSGELWLHSAGNMKGFLNNTCETSSIMDAEGWLRTGDIAHFDEDGFLFITARLKEIIKYKGFQVAPTELENVLLSHPNILEAAVIGTEDIEAGEIPVACVVRRPGSRISSEDIILYVAKQVASYKKVRKVIFVDSIPKSSTGKVLRNKLRSNLVSKM